MGLLLFVEQVYYQQFKTKSKTMSTSDLFALRNKIIKGSFTEFKKFVTEDKLKLDHSILTNLLLLVYGSEPQRKNLMDYLSYFIQFDFNIVHSELGNQRRLLEDLCFYGKVEEMRQLIGIMLPSDTALQNYHFNKLVALTLEGKNSNDPIIAIINELLNVRKYMANGGQTSIQGEENMLVMYALKKELILPALELLRFKIGILGRQCQELFLLASLKINKRQVQNLYKFIEAYLDRSKCNPRHTDIKGKRFIEYLHKDYQNTVDKIVRQYEQSLQRKDHHIRRSQNKVRSTLGQGQYPKQYSTESMHVSSKEKVTISIQNIDDELSIQREANQIFQKHINEKEKYYRYEKNQKKEPQTRVGIMKSDELRFYLEEDIHYQVKKIQDENNKYRPYYLEIIHKLKEKLTKTLPISLQVFGSFQTTLCLPESDIDIVVIQNQAEGSNLPQQIYPVRLLQSINQLLLDMKEQIESVKLIKTASVPIIKVICTEKYLQKRIDITFRDMNHNGIESVQLIRHYLEEYSQLLPLIFILKKFIYTSNLFAPYLGGLSSYGLILMIVAFIQQQYKLHELDDKQEPLKVADLLIGFLKFYGFKMNYVMKCIQVFKKEEHDWSKYTGCLARYTDPTNPTIDLQPKLVIIDPLNETNNIGRSTHKIKQIQMAFEIAYLSIHTFKTCGKRRRCESYRRIAKTNVDLRYTDNVRPCCILKRMFNCTEKFIKE